MTNKNNLSTMHVVGAVVALFLGYKLYEMYSTKRNPPRSASSSSSNIWEELADNAKKSTSKSSLKKKEEHELTKQEKRSRQNSVVKKNLDYQHSDHEVLRSEGDMKNNDEKGGGGRKKSGLDTEAFFENPSHQRKSSFNSNKPTENDHENFRQPMLDNNNEKRSRQSSATNNLLEPFSQRKPSLARKSSTGVESLRNTSPESTDGKRSRHNSASKPLPESSPSLQRKPSLPSQTEDSGFPNRRSSQISFDTRTTELPPTEFIESEDEHQRSHENLVSPVPHRVATFSKQNSNVDSRQAFEERGSEGNLSSHHSQSSSPRLVIKQPSFSTSTSSRKQSFHHESNEEEDFQTFRALEFLKQLDSGTIDNTTDKRVFASTGFPLSKSPETSTSPVAIKKQLSFRLQYPPAETQEEQMEEDAKVAQIYEFLTSTATPLSLSSQDGNSKDLILEENTLPSRPLKKENEALHLKQKKPKLSLEEQFFNKASANIYEFLNHLNEDMDVSSTFSSQDILGSGEILEFSPHEYQPEAKTKTLSNKDEKEDDVGFDLGTFFDMDSISTEAPVPSASPLPRRAQVKNQDGTQLRSSSHPSSRLSTKEMQTQPRSTLRSASPTLKQKDTKSRGHSQKKSNIKVTKASLGKYTQQRGFEPNAKFTLVEKGQQRQKKPFRG